MTTRIFIILVALQVLLEFVIGVSILINFPYVVETGFQLTHSSDMDVFGVVIGLQLILLSILMIFSILWTNKANVAGPIVGIAAGIYFFMFGLMAFIKFGDIQAIYVDSIRGLITAILGYLVYRNLNKLNN